MIKIMIADDNVELCSTCYKFLAKDKDIEVISCTYDGISTLEKYFQNNPDILLLDLDLPKINGIDIINLLCLKETERNKCNVIVISGTPNMRFNLLNTSKVYRIIPKPVNFEYLLSSIKEIESSIKPNNFLEKNIRKLLSDLKLYSYSKGSTYLVDAIEIAYNDPKSLKKIENVYTEIAHIHNVQSNQVKWSIRNTISLVNKHISDEKLNAIFKIYDTKYTITPKYFLTSIIEYLN